MRKILRRIFFERDGEKVAMELLGKFLVRRLPRKSASGLRKSASREAAIMINEVEVYDGFRDKASQASRGKTKRNFPMFGPAGCAYVYFDERRARGRVFSYTASERRQNIVASYILLTECTGC